MNPIGDMHKRKSEKAYLCEMLVIAIAILISMCVLPSCQSASEIEAEEDIYGLDVSDQEYIETESSSERSQSSIRREHEAVPKDSKAMDKASKSTKNLISKYGDSVAVSVLPLNGQPGFSINGDKQFVSASMIKLLILADYLDAVESGILSGDAIYKKRSKDIVGGTGKMQYESSKIEYTFEELAKYMISYSDNTATNVLISTLGMDSINSKARDLGLEKTKLQRLMMDVNSGIENYISANEAASLLAQIANHTLAGDAECEAAEKSLLMQEDNEGLAKGIPSEIRFGHKTGNLDSVRHDGGIVYSRNPYVIVVLTELNESEANQLMGQISKTVYECLSN